jgi:cytochrome c biogenesis protein CcdA
MTENKIMKQITAIFGVFMVFFYLGVGGYFVFSSDLNYIDKALRVIMGSTLMLYGIYRAVRTFKQIADLFSRKDKEDNGLY